MNPPRYPLKENPSGTPFTDTPGFWGFGVLGVLGVLGFRGFGV